VQSRTGGRDPQSCVVSELKHEVTVEVDETLPAQLQASSLLQH
jgi:hypothetical protein